ncbi:MAG: hypothetical protein FWC39_02480 [Bacteroidetes bacterium]|nr:hypothetical protein [Bacteroidota bacterium]
MKKFILLIFVCLPAYLSAQHGWERVNYTQSMLFSAEVRIGNKAATQGDVVGAFINGECRMVAPVLVINGKSTISSVVHGETNEELEEPEEIVFKLWRMKNNTILTATKTVEMKIGSNAHNYILHFKK